MICSFTRKHYKYFSSGEFFLPFGLVLDEFMSSDEPLNDTSLHTNQTANLIQGNVVRDNGNYADFLDHVNRNSNSQKESAGLKHVLSITDKLPSMREVPNVTPSNGEVLSMNRRHEGIQLLEDNIYNKSSQTTIPKIYSFSTTLSSTMDIQTTSVKTVEPSSEEYVVANSSEMFESDLNPNYSESQTMKILDDQNTPKTTYILKSKYFGMHENATPISESVNVSNINSYLDSQADKRTHASNNLPSSFYDTFEITTTKNDVSEFHLSSSFQSIKSAIAHTVEYYPEKNSKVSSNVASDIVLTKSSFQSSFEEYRKSSSEKSDKHFTSKSLISIDRRTEDTGFPISTLDANDTREKVSDKKEYGALLHRSSILKEEKYKRNDVMNETSNRLLSGIVTDPVTYSSDTALEISPSETLKEYSEIFDTAENVVQVISEFVDISQMTQPEYGNVDIKDRQSNYRYSSPAFSDTGNLKSDAADVDLTKEASQSKELKVYLNRTSVVHTSKLSTLGMYQTIVEKNVSGLTESPGFNTSVSFVREAQIGVPRIDLSEYIKPSLQLELLSSYDEVEILKTYNISQTSIENPIELSEFIKPKMSPVSEVSWNNFTKDETLMGTILSLDTRGSGITLVDNHVVKYNESLSLTESRSVTSLLNKDFVEEFKPVDLYSTSDSSWTLHRTERSSFTSLESFTGFSSTTYQVINEGLSKSSILSQLKTKDNLNTTDVNIEHAEMVFADDVSLHHQNLNEGKNATSDLAATRVPSSLAYSSSEIPMYSHLTLTPFTCSCNKTSLPSTLHIKPGI